MAFVHLHTHTQYSLLDGSNKIKDYVARVKELGMTAAAITDHGVMYGCMDFYKECEKQGVSPVLGCEVYVASGSRFDRETVKGDDRYYHLILLAENDQGYANLVKIVSAGFIDGFYYKPRVDFEILEMYHEGIICLSACLAGEVARNLAKGDYEAAKAVAMRYRDCFGEGNYFLEMQDHGIPTQKNVNQGLLRMSKETGIPLVVTNDCHYTYEDDADAHDVLLCIQTGKSINDTERLRYEGGQYFVKSEEEMAAIFPYAREAMENTQKIADRCHVTINRDRKLPVFAVPEGYDSWSYLNELCSRGFEKRWPDKPRDLRERLDFELSVIKNMGFVDYFLIVWDFINYARTNGIPVGPGRGSAAGSIVSYTLGITNVDPIKYQLLFERFLNPERVSMPDIDVDFCYNRRGEVIDYVVEKYGVDCVTQIVTFGTMAAKNAIRDVARVLDLSYQFADQIAKAIPQELNITIKDALVKNPELRQRYENEPEVRKVIDTAIKLEGLPRHTSMHAAGVVIAQKPMDEYVPLARGSDGTIVTQYTMVTIEELGLLKMDFLGLRTLTVIDDAVRAVRSDLGVDLDIDNIPFDDPAVYALIGSGRTEGIFQLESAGMKNFMKELRPESLEDVIAGISLYRPGPMDFIPIYIKGKNDRSSITYDCPQLEPILAPTYGCIVYQEQVMQIVRDLAGFSLGRSDLMRRAMSKKKLDVMNKEREAFVYGDPEAGVPGCIANGIDEAIANKIYDEMIDFAKYAFNKSHAACYAIVAYQTAYLKCYYPVQFMAALLTSIMDNSAKVSEYIGECRSLGIKVLPPDVNRGRGEFAADGDAIRFGMNAIKSVGRPTSAAIVEERERNGEFKSIFDLIERMTGSQINKRAIENLIRSGALDTLPGNRRQKINEYPAICDRVASDRKNNLSGQMSFFDFLGEEEKEKQMYVLPPGEEFPKEILLAGEKDVLGIYVSGHPLDDYRKLLEKNTTARSIDFLLPDEEGVHEAPVSGGKSVVVGGLLTEKTVRPTKNNLLMAYITIEDMYGSLEVLVFPKIYDKYRDLLNEDSKLFITGRSTSDEDRDAKLIADRIIPFEDMPREVWIAFDDMNAFNEAKSRLIGVFSSRPGADVPVIFIRDGKMFNRMKDYGFSADEDVLARLRDMFGSENVKAE